MEIDRGRLERIGRALIHEARVEKVPFLAGSIAYHAFVSLLPLFALLLYVAGGLNNAAMEDGLISLSRAVFTEGSQEVMINEIRSARQSTGLSVLGVVVLLWGTLRIFRGLDTAFSDIYETEAENTLPDQFSDGLLVLSTFGVAVSIAVFVYQAFPAEGPLTILQPIVLVGGLTLVLLPMYYVFPDTDVSVGEILPGTVLAAIGLTVFQAGFQLYVTSGEQNVLSGILLLLMWLYVSGFVILIGVVVNAVFSNRSADVSIEPVIGGVSPLDGTDRWTKTELQHAMSTINARVDSSTPIELVIDGENVDLPSPQQVEVSTEESLLGIGSEVTTLSLEWVPEEDEGAAGEDGAGATETEADAETGTDSADSTGEPSD